MLVAKLVWSSIIPALDLAEITSRSDLIIVARVAALDAKSEGQFAMDRPEPAVRVLTATLSCAQVIKGDTPCSDVAVSIEIPYAPMGYQTVALGTSGLFFLSRRDSKWVPATHFHWATPGSVSALSSSDPPYEKVLRTIGAAAVCTKCSQRNRIEAIRLLSHVPERYPTPELYQSFQDNDPAIKYLSAAALLQRQDDPRILAIIAPQLLKADSLDPGIASLLGSAIQDKSASVLERDDLRLLVTSRYVPLRRGAVAALRRIASNESIPTLLMALADSDRYVRYYAASALGNLTQQYEWQPDTSSFFGNESKYVQHWRSWATDNRYDLSRR